MDYSKTRHSVWLDFLGYGGGGRAHNIGHFKFFSYLLFLTLALNSFNSAIEVSFLAK